MADIRFFGEYCIVTDNKSGETIIAAKITGRVETMQAITKYTDIKAIPVTKIPVLKDGEVAEDNKLYIVDGKVTLVKEVLPIEIIKEIDEKIIIDKLIK